MLTEVLTHHGFTVYTAENGDAALSTLHQTAVDLIITDTMQPRWDGELPVLQQLQQAAPGTPLVLFTAYIEAESLDVAACGLAAVWLKPMSLAQLVSAVRALLHDSAP